MGWACLGQHWHSELAECPWLLTSVFCLHPQHCTLFISQFYPSGTSFLSFSPKDDGLMSWVGTGIPKSPKPCLLGNFPLQRRTSLPLKVCLIQGQEMGDRNFLVSGDDTDLRPCTPISQGLCSEDQSLVQDYAMVTDVVFGWNSKRGG